MDLGLIEGFYGTPWSFAERTDVVARLAPHGYGFYLYAPKSDGFLRRGWHEQHPHDIAQSLWQLSVSCREQGVRFGVGLSPFELYWNFDRQGGEALRHKIAMLDEIGIDDLAILFDDMRGDLPALARIQVDIVDFAAAHTGATRLIVAPTYYSDDPVLDRFFGQRPEGYLEDLGRMLDPEVEIFWTGPEVCSREYTTDHLERVADQLQRKPFLWDNYPVNDGPRMSQHLHLRAFSGRPASIDRHIVGHAVNPASQPTLSLIPALTLAESYARASAYDESEAFDLAAKQILGSELAALVTADLHVLQDVGLDNLGPAAGLLRARYKEIDHPAAREIVDWLDGAWRVARDTRNDGGGAVAAMSVRHASVRCSPLLATLCRVTANTGGQRCRRTSSTSNDRAARACGEERHQPTPAAASAFALARAIS
jgi:hyaluronoglucosaminidase